MGRAPDPASDPLCDNVRAPLLIEAGGGVVATNQPDDDWDEETDLGGLTTTHPHRRDAPPEEVQHEPLFVIASHPDPRWIGHRVPIPQGRSKLGRGRTAWTSPTENGRMSRSHVGVERNADRVTVCDLGSMNGTCVNDRRLSDPRRSERIVVNDRDLLRFGDVLLVLRHGPIEVHRSDTLGGASHEWGRVLRVLERVAPLPTAVCLLGEPGVGKELLARQLHRHSGRSGAFAAVNCGAVSSALLHSELFGHERGAFSGASAARRGVVREAEGGTLLLDEIGDAPLEFQVSLLRLLEQNEVRPVGADRAHRVDVRFVAATHQELPAAVESGSFRADLWSRIGRWVVRIPPLRERPEDIAVLAARFVRELGGDPRCLTPEVMVTLLRHGWPGNARELHGVVDRLVADTNDGISPLPWLLEVLESPPPVPQTTPRIRSRRGVHPAVLREALNKTNGNVRATASNLGVSRRTLYRWMRQARIDPHLLREPRS
jgi:transcriptional regulator with PAS, ATPase and Fis domain